MRRLVILALAFLPLRATYSSTETQQDFAVRFKWDAKYVMWKANADPLIIDAINKIANKGMNDRLKAEVISYTEIGNDQYAALIEIGLGNVNDLSMQQRQSLFKYNGAYLYIVDLENSGHILSSRNLGDEESITGGLYGSDYGCMQDHIPIFRADINHDEHPEVLYFTSQPNGINFGVDDWVKLHILRGTDFKEVGDTLILRDNASSQGGYLFDKNDDVIEPYKAGIHSYAKLFFGDLEDKKKLNILVWHRNYAATNMKFTSENFELYTMSPDVTFIKTDLTPEQGHALLKKKNLTWKQGFPNQNFCNSEGKPTDKPLITNIDDPVLK